MTTTRGNFNKFLKIVADSGTLRRLEGAWYTTVRKTNATSRFGPLLIAPPGGGNNGDQAMFESFLRNTPGPVTVVFNSPQALSIPPELVSRVDVHVLSGLFQGRPQLSPTKIWKLGRLIRNSTRLVVIGADIVDGSYGLREAWARVQALRLALRLGIPARVIGFSWSSLARPEIERAYRELSTRGAEFFVRDKYSDQRLSVARINARLVPDTVFALMPKPDDSDPNIADRYLQKLGKPIALVNISGLLRKRFDLVDEYVRLIHELRELGYSIVLLPHVIRSVDDDLAAAEEVLKAVGDSSVRLVESLLTPAQIQELASHTAITITGRMHLGILSLTVGTPCIVFGTQGKVEGMLALFELENLSVEPDHQLAEDTIRLVRWIRANDNHVRSCVSSNLNRVVADSRVNFE